MPASLFLRSQTYLLGVLASLCSFVAHAAPAEVAIHAGFTLGVIAGQDSVAFDMPAEFHGLRAYADKEPLARMGSIAKCDLTELGGPKFSSTVVRLWLSDSQVTRIESTLRQWRASMATDRVLAFSRNGRLVHGHDASLATISESMLYLHVGPKNEAQAVLEAVCGDA